VAINGAIISKVIIEAFAAGLLGNVCLRSRLRYLYKDIKVIMAIARINRLIDRGPKFE
jgi:hypothetical protein